MFLSAPGPERGPALASTGADYSPVWILAVVLVVGVILLAVSLWRDRPRHHVDVTKRSRA